MSEDWSGLAAEVADALGEVSGNQAQLVESVTVGATPVRPGTTTKVRHPLAATETKFTWKELQSGAVQTGDLKLVVQAPPFTPEPAKHTIEWGGKPYQIMDAQPLRPDGAVTVLCALHLRA